MYAHQNFGRSFHYQLMRGTPVGVSGFGQAPLPLSDCVSFDAAGNCLSYAAATYQPPAGTVAAPSPFAGLSAWIAANTSTVYIVAAGLFGLAVLKGGRRR
jgi:hypothetical protein